MSEWRVGKIGDLARVRSGFAFKSEQWTTAGVPVVKIGNVKAGRLEMDGCSFVTIDDADRSGFTLNRGDILIGLTGYVGDIARVRTSKPLVLNQRVGKVFPTHGDADFLFHLLCSCEVRTAIERAAHGSAQANVSPTAIEQISITIPPPTQQRAIARILGALDDKIELNRQMNETLEALARALFQSWFVDFDPVRAKMRGERPVGMDAATAALFPSRLVQTEHGEVPEGWRATTLGEVIEILDARRIPLSAREREARPGPYPYYGAAAQMDAVDGFLFDGIHILLGEDGSVVKPDGTPYLQYVWGKFWVNNHAHVLKGVGISDEHLLLHLKNTNISAFVNGAVQAKLNQANMRLIPFIRSTEAVSTAFGNLIAPLFARFRHNDDESKPLAATRDLLLPRLLSGELRVPDAERLVAEAV